MLKQTEIGNASFISHVKRALRPNSLSLTMKHTYCQQLPRKAHIKQELTRYLYGILSYPINGN